MIVIKRDGHEESFNRNKAYKSVYESCLNAHHKKKNAIIIAKKVINDLVKELHDKKKTNTDEIFKLISTLLEKYDVDAAFLYETHRDVS